MIYDFDFHVKVQRVLPIEQKVKEIYTLLLSNSWQNFSIDSFTSCYNC